MTPVALRIHLKGGTGFDLILPVSEAENVFHAWASRKFGIDGKPVFEGRTIDNARYAVLFTEVASMLILPVQIQQGLTNQKPGWGSGGQN